MENEYNKIHARVEIKTNLITLEYEHEGELYEIQVPKTESNKHFKDGEMVTIKLVVVL